jgi:hypothetical protein
VIAVVGDVHGDASVISRLLQLHPPVAAIVQVGDLGWFPETLAAWRSVRFPVPFYFIDGNHGRRIAFLGGGASPDKFYRLAQRLPWSAKENVTPAEFARLDAVEAVDILVTHVPPQSTIDRYFDPMDLPRYFGLPPTWRDPNAALVETLWRRLACPPLVCGHMHRSVVDRTVRLLDINEIVLL